MFGKKSKRIKDLEAKIKLLESDVEIYQTSNALLHGELIDLKARCFIRNAKGQIVKYN